MKKITDDVLRERARFGPGGGMTRIVEVWEAAVGPTIARNAWPARIARDGTLHVATSSSAWAFELAQLEREVARRLRAAAGAAAPPAIRFAIGPLPERGHDDPETQRQRPREPAAEQLEQAGALAAAIEDEELRKLVAKAAALSLARAGSDRGF